MKVIVNFLLVYLFCITAISAQEILLLKSSGKVVIGDTSQIMTPGNYNLYVQNGILTERVKVALKSSADWADDAFDKTPTLSQVEESIAKNQHLPSMPSAATLVENGYELKDMDALLLQQIEWLWQHLLTVSKQNEAMAREIEILRKKLKEESSSSKQE